MTFERKKVATALAHILGVGGAAALVAAPAIAQQSEIRVEVTGSNIKRVEGEGALPVQTITREEISKSGVQTSFELLDRLSASMAFNNYNETIALGDSARPGFSGVSLRGLGPDKTLVLLNGRRIANFALGTGAPGVDLNAIPISAIERVEILKDGASAIYGTDAIAGVINFITRKDYTGIEATAAYYAPEAGGGEQTRANITAGWGDLASQKFNAWITVDYLKNESLAAKDREFSKTAYLPRIGNDRTSGNSFPANVLVPAGRNPTDPTPNAGAGVLSPVCAPPVSFPTTASPHQCRYDYASRVDIIDPSEHWNVLGRVTWQFHPDHQAFLDAAFSHNKFTFAVSEVPWSEGTTGIPLQLPPTSPFYPTSWLQANYPNIVGQPLDVLWRTIPAGRRTDESTTEQTRVVAGVKGTLFKNWDYEAAYNYNRSHISDRYVDGWLDLAIAQPLFDSGILNPFGPLDAAGQAALNTAKINDEVQAATGTVQSADFKMSGDIYQLPAGPLAIAFGGEYRREELSQFRAAILNDTQNGRFPGGRVIGGGGPVGSLPDSSRNVKALFAELNVPIVKTLEAQLALRWDDYSDFGNTTNPKVALRWQPTKQVLVRGSWSKGFHAPSLIDLYLPTYLTNTLGSFSDPLRCPVTESPLDCDIQFNKQQGGNPHLKPEKADSWTAGIVLEPIDPLSVSFDYFHIKATDLLGQTSENTIAPTMSDVNSPYIVRGPVDPQFPNLPGPILYFVAPTVNIGKTEVNGVDIDGTFRFPKLDWGQFVARIVGTYYIDYKQSQDDGSFPNFVGTRGDFGAIPRWKHVASLDWTFGPWNATLVQSYTLHYKEDCLAADPTGCETRKVGSYEVYDLSAAYTGFKNTTLRIGVKNVFDRDPPLSNQNATFQVGYDPSSVDPRGRTWWGSIRYAFK